MRYSRILYLISIFIFVFFNSIFSQVNQGTEELDEKVRTFLEKNRHKWHDLNVPRADGKLLFDLIIKHDYKNALEIGTSTGHSGIWIAWALSKTGGKLITVEINERRYKEALANFEEAGLSKYIDARLADAHELVPKLKGPFDFVFCDADKDWYTNYFKAVEPNLLINGCFAAHNVTGRNRRSRRGGTSEYYNYVKSIPNYETTIFRESRSGLAVSYKKSNE